MDTTGNKAPEAQPWKEAHQRELGETIAQKSGPDWELFKAISDNNPWGVSSWLLHGADANARAYGMEAPLFWAGYGQKDPRIVELLLDRGANVRARNGYGQTPLHVAAQYGGEAQIRTLLDRGAEIEARDRFGETPLHKVTERSGIEQMRCLVSRGADVNARTKTGQTPLHIAASCGEEEHLRVLIQGGAKIDARDVTGRTPLFCAAIPPRVEQLTYLVGSGADVSVRDGVGKTPLDVLRDLRGNPEWCKRHGAERVGEEEHRWQLLRGFLGGFTTVKVTEARPDSVVIRVEGHHGRYLDALQAEEERRVLTVPTELVFGRDIPKPGELVQCPRGISPVLDKEWHRRMEIQQQREARDNDVKLQ